MATSTFAIDSVTVGRNESGAIQVGVAESAAEATQTRVMFDIDNDSGTGFGEYGADYMIEGATLYSYPSTATGWDWVQVGTVPNAVADGVLTYSISALPKFKVMRLYVENFDADWNVVDRYPETDAISVDAAQLETLSPMSNSSLRGSLYRSGSKGLAVKVLGEGVEPARLRVLLNSDGEAATGLSPFGADYMIEGLTLYQHAGTDNGWNWTPLYQLSPDVHPDGVVYPIDDIDIGDALDFSIERTNSNWEVLDRYPAQGAKRVNKETMGEYSFNGPDQQVGPKKYQIEELIAFVPDALSISFSTRFDSLPWSDAALSEPIWKAPGFEEAFRLRFALCDAKSGEEFELQPERVQIAGGMTQWQGSTAGVDWRVIAQPSSQGDLELYAQLNGAGERLLRFRIGVEAPLDGWTWHDDVQFAQEIDAQNTEYAHTGSSPYGIDSSVSKYPFGVVDNGAQALVLETDLTEPCVFKISANTERDQLAIDYHVALTPLTKKFPGQAAFHVSLRSRATEKGQAFRQALAEYYQRNASLFERRPEAVGLWMPFTDISKIPNPQDFGFAYYEKGGPIGSDVDFCHDNGILTLVYTEPWLYWLPMPGGMERTPENAIAMMERLAVSGFGKANEFASGGLLGAARLPDGEINMTFSDVPWNSGARMEVSTDPELPTEASAPVNRAMAEFSFMQEQIAYDKVDGIYLDSLSAMFIMDYNPAVMAVANYPATFTTDAMKPGLATPIAAYEFIAGLGGYMSEHDKYLMGNFPCWNFPFFMPFIDIPGEETHWFHEGHYERMSDRELNYRRAMSGQKAWGFLMNGKYDHLEAEFAQRYFEDSLYWAFQPSLFSHDAANDPYWENSAWYERDRHWFQRYMPWIQRIANVGWQPVGPAESSNDAIEFEQFYGKRDAAKFITVRNTSQAPVSGQITVELDDFGQDWVVLNPLSGDAGWLSMDANGRAAIPVFLQAEQVRFFMIFPSKEIESEIEFLRAWKDGVGQAEQLLGQLKAMQEQQALGLKLVVLLPQPAVRGLEQSIRINVENKSKSTVQIDEVALLSAGEPMVSQQKVTLGTGESGNLMLSVPADFNDGAFRVSIAMRKGSEQHRLLIPLMWQRVNPVNVELTQEKVISIQEVAQIPLRLTNLLQQPSLVDVRWRGDYGEGRKTFQLDAVEETRVYLPIRAGGKESGTVALKASAMGFEIFDGSVELQFLGQQASVVRDTAVLVETSSDFPGYGPSPLRDGVTEPTASMAFNEAAWASEESASPHWVRFEFPEPVEVSEVKLYWNHEGGVTYTSQEGVIRGRTVDGQRRLLTRFQNAETTNVTTVSFTPTTVASLEILQPARRGPQLRPNILWLTEIEVR
ncbi:discoidin domain-containing protein [Cerasicoccus fimbriatus]|uniref:discoidin domain-containing protein n=1 Tax=Cerasicoccus fimbriatus TaxID=3014554 RepID=UPI0022B2D0B9|nr:discoidin domain-containing protein [Cerasicoccus sp. TK19100]